MIGSIQMYLAYLSIFLLLIFPSQSQKAEWDLEKDKSGIKVYTREIDGSAYKAFKATCNLESTSLTQVFALLTDVGLFDQIFPDSYDVKLLERDGELYQMFYMATRVPWPVSDRDSAYEQIISYDKNKKEIRIKIVATPDELPSTDGKIRMEKGNGYWLLTDLGDGKVRAVYQFHAEPGGSVPAWIANSFVVNNPYGTIVNLKKYIKEGKGKEAEFKFLKN